MTFEEIMDTRNGVERIISHRGQGRNTKVQVLWDNGEMTWECLQHMRDQVDDIVAQYACNCGLLEESGWKRAANFVRLKCTVQIKSHRFVRNTVEFEVWCDGDDEAEWIDKDEVDVTRLDEYVSGKDIPFKGRWKWLQVTRQGTEGVGSWQTWKTSESSTSFEIESNTKKRSNVSRQIYQV